MVSVVIKRGGGESNATAPTGFVVPIAPYPHPILVLRGPLRLRGPLPGATQLPFPQKGRSSSSVWSAFGFSLNGAGSVLPLNFATSAAYVAFRSAQ